MLKIYSQKIKNFLKITVYDINVTKKAALICYPRCTRGYLLKPLKYEEWLCVGTAILRICYR